MLIVLISGSSKVSSFQLASSVLITNAVLSACLQKISNMKELPIGLQDFRYIRSNNCIYIDKTEHIYKLLAAKKIFLFLSRPRRFGKSLLLSMIKALMEGRRELFEGLYIEDKFNWEPHPVILLDMGLPKNSSVEVFERSLEDELRRLAQRFNIMLKEGTASVNNLLADFVSTLQEKTGKSVVLLIDEYDKPLLDNIDNLELASGLRKILSSFYGVIKTMSSDLFFVMLTGISKISQASIFSGLNNLYDLTMDPEHSTICGYTKLNLEDYFKEYTNLLATTEGIEYDQMLKKIHQWYDGYSWDSKTFVYNPFSILLLYYKKEFAAHWFATATPTFLLKRLKQLGNFSAVFQDDIIQCRGFLDQESLENLQLIPLLFQTGYLTVRTIDLDGKYHLCIPNYEVRVALTESLIRYLIETPITDTRVIAESMRASFARRDIVSAMDHLCTLFASISYDTHIPREGYYHAIFQIVMNLIGIDSLAEVHTDKGRIDSVLKFPDRTYVIEFKYASTKASLNKKLSEGMEQIKENAYYERYRIPHKELHLIAVAFTRGKFIYEFEDC